MKTIYKNREIEKRSIINFQPGFCSTFVFCRDSEPFGERMESEVAIVGGNARPTTLPRT